MNNFRLMVFSPFFSLALLLVLSLGLVLQLGCVTTRSSLKKQEEIDTTISTLQKGGADLTVQQKDLQDEIRVLSGRIEVLEKESIDLKISNEEEKSVIAENQELKNKEKTEDDNNIKLILESLAKFEQRLGKIEAKLKTRKKVKAKRTTVKKKGNYQQAESDFVNKKWQEAALGYQKYRELNPKGNSYPRSTYQMALCFLELKLKDEAKIFLEELVAVFPSNSYGKKAKEKLKKLK